MNTFEKVEKIKNTIKEKECEPEIISLIAFKKAMANISVMQINNEADAFLYYASLNLLNAYVKQNKNSYYYFKSCVTDGFDIIIQNSINASYYYDNNENLLIVDILGVQFSFHSVKPSIKMDFVKKFKDKFDKEYYKIQDWQGIRLQPQAETLFNLANNLEELSNKSVVGNLKEFQEEYVKLDLENI